MAGDPYKYFRIEARELLDGLARGILDLEKGAGGADGVARLLRYAHTLKGAARVVKQPGIADRAHAMEDVLARCREGACVPADVGALLELLDAMTAGVAALDAPPPPLQSTSMSTATATETSTYATTPTNPTASAHNGAAPAAPEPLARAAEPEPYANVRVDIGELDGLLEGLFEVHVRLTTLERSLDELGRAQRLAASLAGPQANGTRGAALELQTRLATVERELRSGIEQASREVAEARERADRLRLMPASAVFAPLERAVRDVAHALGRQATLATAGGDERVEAHVLATLREGLLHVVRNAVVHGIEPPAERRAAGKPERGTVHVEVRRRDRRMAFVCRDDGRGIDSEAVRRAAVTSGLLTRAAADALDGPAALRLILQSGLSTEAGHVTQLAGRGVGLDVLRAAVAELKGEVTIQSEPGRGTTLEVLVPISVSSMTTLVVAAGATQASLPLDAVRTTLRVRDADVAVAAGREAIAVGDEVIPLIPLGWALDHAAPRPPRPPLFTAVVLRGESGAAALVVERLVGTAHVVVRPLPRLAVAEALVAGVALDGEGQPHLVLDPARLVDAARDPLGPLRPVAAAAAAPPPPVLVVDDSLTTRMLEQSILESAGYEVTLATSAEEGLELARTRPFRLFVVDVEMPGMNGFEFVAQTRQDPELRGIPAILVTSRNAPADKLRGAEVGARAYIVKSEFDQGQLLATIRTLVG